MWRGSWEGGSRPEPGSPPARGQLEIPIIEDFVEMGREEGVQVGREEGIQDGLRLAIFDLLTSRGLDLGEAHRHRIEHERDVSALMAFHRRAAMATSVEEIFRE